MSATINLTALAEARVQMTFGRLRECCAAQPESHPCRLVWSDDDTPAFSMEIDDGKVAKDDVQGIVAEHNAMPVLLEVVRTLLAYNAAKAKQRATGDAAHELYRARIDHQKTLAKVSL